MDEDMPEEIPEDLRASGEMCSSTEGTGSDVRSPPSDLSLCLLHPPRLRKSPCVLVEKVF
jgi:hypothetical protein